MWAALLVHPLEPWWPPNAVFITKPPPRFHSIAVHNSQNAKKIRDFGEAVISDHKSDDPLHRHAVKPKIKKKLPSPLPAEAEAAAAAAAAEEEEEEEEEQELTEQQQQRQLSGADVLMALQRTTAHKARKIKDKKEAARTVPGSRNHGGRENRGSSPFSNVKPLCIKPEWSAWLEELERRLNQLAQR